jgi:hypothetical protein
MAEPILIIHGVANHDSAFFLKNVETLQGRLGPAWCLVPVFWGDLGGASQEIDDCLPAFASGQWGVRSEEDLAAATLTRSDVGGGNLSNDERAALIATSVSPGGEEGVRSPDVVDVRVAEAARQELPNTRVLQYIDDPSILRHVGEAARASIGPAPSGSGSDPGLAPEEEVRGWLDPAVEAAKRVIRSVDDILGRFLGDRLGQFNQALRGAVAGPFAQFFGDIFVYQRNQEPIQQRIWDAIAQHAPEYGTKERPVNAIAHSLGGVIMFDAAVQPDARGRQLWLKSFTTFGSQAAFFHILDRRRELQRYSRGNPVKLPPSIGRWTNLWDTLDMLAFTAGTVFRLHNDQAPTDVPVEDPLSLLIQEEGWTHSIYWKTEQLLDALRRTLVS